MRSYKKVFKKLFSLFMTAVLTVSFMPSLPAAAIDTKKYPELHDLTKKEWGVSRRIREQENSVFGNKTLSQLYGGAPVYEKKYEKVNSTDAGSYVIEFSTNHEPDDWFDCDMALVYLGTDGNIYYTNKFNLTNKATDFLEQKDEFDKGQREMVSVKLPSICETVIAIYIEKGGSSGYNDDPWKFSYMDVYKATDKIGDINSADGDKFRNYNGVLVGNVSQTDCDMGYLDNDDDYQEWLYVLENQYTTDSEKYQSGEGVQTQYLLDIVMGANGFVGDSGSIDIALTYIDLDGKEQVYEHSVTSRSNKDTYLVDNIYEKSVVSNMLVNYGTDTKDKKYTDITSRYPGKNLDWDEGGMNEINLVAALLTGNFVTGTRYDARVFAEPYASFNIKINLPKGLKEVKSINISNTVDTSLQAQGITLYRLTDFSDKVMFNGGLSQQVITDWSGYAVAKTNRTLYMSSDLVSVERGDLVNLYGSEQVYVDNSGESIGFGVCFADVDGAGIDAFNPIHTDLSTFFEDIFDDDSPFNELNGNFLMSILAPLNNASSSFNISVFDKKPDNNSYSSMNHFVSWIANRIWVFNECLYMTVTYEDIFGYTRRVSIPYTTAATVQAANDTDAFNAENYGKLEYSILGFANQGQELALRTRLSHFKELKSVTLDFADRNKAKTISPNFDTYAEGDRLESDLFSVNEGQFADEEISIRAVNYYGKVDKDSLHTVLEANTGYFDNHIENTEEEKSFIPEPINGIDREGYVLTRNSSLSFEYDDLSDDFYDYSDDLGNAYLIKLGYQTSSDSNELYNRFGTSADVFYTLHYTDKNGEKKDTKLHEMREDVHQILGSKEEFTLDGDVIDYTYLSETGLFKNEDNTGHIVCWLDEEPESIDGITISLEASNYSYGDIWQINSIEIQKLDEMSRIMGKFPAENIFYFLGEYFREFEGTKVAYANMPVMFSTENGFEKTINFVTIDEDGNENRPDSDISNTEDNYLTSIPSSMTFEEVTQNLGLAVPKCEYTINVNVADVPDAGSNNHFYFQLLFKRGKSGVVLANQQLAADGFRQGTTETFTIKTTQNYGELIGVKIICDAASSKSDSFDKLNIASVDVLMNNSGIGKRWTVDNVGWVDIVYLEEGITSAYNTSDVLKLTNSQISKDYPVTSSGNVMELLFTFNFSNANRTKADVNARLFYTDTDKNEIITEFNLTDKLVEYVDGRNSTIYPYLNKIALSVSDISSLKRIEFYSEDPDFNMDINSIAVEQVIGLGDLYAVSSNEYERHIDQLIPITHSQNSVTLDGAMLKSVSFANNNISIDTNGDEWGSSISRYPTVDDYSVNLYIFGGTMLGKEYSFDENSADLNVVINHRTLFNSNTVKATRAKVSDFGYSNGKPCMYIKDFDVNNLSTIESLELTSTQTEGSMPVVGYALIEIVNSGVIVDTVYVDFYNSYIIDSVTGYVTPGKTIHNDYVQNVYMMLADGQDDVLIPEESDVAVAIRYTSELDAANAKHVYQSPYVFLADVNINDLSRHLIVEVPFEIDGVDEIVGLSVQTSGPVVEFENAVIYNCYDNTEKTVKNSAHITDSFTAKTKVNNITKDKTVDTVSIVTLDIATPAETEIAGAGYMGNASMTVNYLDANNLPLSFTIDNITPYIEGSTASGNTARIKLLANTINKIESIVFDIDDNDPWYISTVSATISQKDGSTKDATGLANGWAELSNPLTVSFTASGEDATANAVVSLSINAHNATSDKTATVSSGSSKYFDVIAGDTVSLNAVVGISGSADSSAVWSGDENFGSYSTDGNRMVVTVDSNATVGHIGTFTATSAADSSYSATVKLRVVEDTSSIQETEAYTLKVDVNGSVLKNEEITSDTSLSFNIDASETVTVTAVTANGTDKIEWSAEEATEEFFEKTADGSFITVSGNNVSFKTTAYTSSPGSADCMVLKGSYTSGSITHTVTITFNLAETVEYMTVEHFNSSNEVIASTVLSSRLNNIDENQEYFLNISDGDRIVITNLSDGSVVFERPTTAVAVKNENVYTITISDADAWLEANSDTLSINYNDSSDTAIALYRASLTAG